MYRTVSLCFHVYRNVVNVNSLIIFLNGNLYQNYKLHLHTHNHQYLNREKIFGDVSVVGKEEIHTFIDTSSSVFISKRNETANIGGKYTQTFTCFRFMLQLSDVALVTYCNFCRNKTYEFRGKATPGPGIRDDVPSICWLVEKLLVL